MVSFTQGQTTSSASNLRSLPFQTVLITMLHFRLLFLLTAVILIQAQVTKACNEYPELCMQSRTSHLVSRRTLNLPGKYIQEQLKSKEFIVNCELVSVKDSFIEVDLKASSEEGEDLVYPQIQSDDHLYQSCLGQCLGLGSDFFQKKNENPL